MASRRPILHRERPPKGGDIESMLKFVRDQKGKVSEAEVNAKKLENISSESKKRQQFAVQSKSFMEKLRQIIKKVEFSEQLSSSSLIDLSSCLPELPTLLKFDASLKDKRDDDIQKCRDFIDRLQSITTRNTETGEMFPEVRHQLQIQLELLKFPEAYDQIVSVVEKTKLKAASRQTIDTSHFSMELRSRIEDQIAVFTKLEAELSESHRSWLVQNGFDPDAKFGGWDELEHQRFLLTEGNWETEFKNKSDEELHKHERWVIRGNFLAKKRDSLRCELQKRIEQIKEESAKEEEEKAAADIQKKDAENRMKKLKEEKDVIESRLGVEREEKQKKDNEAKAKQKEQQRLKEVQESRLKAISDKQKAEMKKRIIIEKEHRKEVEEKAAAARAEAEKLRATEERIRRKEMVAVVAGRRQIDDDKKKKKAFIEDEKRIMQNEREMRLEALAQSVRDEFGLDYLEADPTKLTKLNVMRRNMENEEKPMYTAVSFPSSLIEADPRIRLENALREAGLQDSAYAQQVMRQMGALKPVPDAAQSHISIE